MYIDDNCVEELKNQIGSLQKLLETQLANTDILLTDTKGFWLYVGLKKSLKILKIS